MVTARGGDMPSAERIVWTAGSLFAEKGYGATTIRDIAAAVGMTASSVYSHFKSKEEILGEFLERSSALANERFRGVLLDHVAERAGEQVAAFVRVAADLASDYPDTVVVTTAELDRAPTAPSEAAKRMRAAVLATLVHVIERGRSEGELPADTGPSETLARMMIGGATYVSTWRRRWANDDRDYAKALGAMARRMVSSTETVSPAVLEGCADAVDAVLRRGAAGDTRTRLQREASALFAKHGYAAVSMRSIAAAVGMRAPSIYAHYPSKRHLLAAALEDHSVRMLTLVRDDLAATAGSSSAARLARYAYLVALHALREPWPLVVGNAELGRLDRDLSAAAGDNRLALGVLGRDLVLAGHATGEFRLTEGVPIALNFVLGMRSDLARWTEADRQPLGDHGIATLCAAAALRMVDVDLSAAR